MIYCNKRASWVTPKQSSSGLRDAHIQRGIDHQEHSAADKPDEGPRRECWRLVPQGAESLFTAKHVKLGQKERGGSGHDCGRYGVDVGGQEERLSRDRRNGTFTRGAGWVNKKNMFSVLISSAKAVKGHEKKSEMKGKQRGALWQED
jgi:hypothetical protein